MTVVSAGKVVAFSNDLVCPGCGRPLEISPISRDFAIAAGLVGAAAVSHWIPRLAGGGALGWVLPVLYPFLAFAVVAALVLMATADVRSRQEAPPLMPAGTAHSGGHGSAPAHH